MKNGLRIITLLILWIIGCHSAFADCPCSSFLIKATLYSKNDKKVNVYLSFKTYRYKNKYMLFNGIDEYGEIYQLINKIDNNKLPKIDSTSKKILAINKSILGDTAIDSNYTYVNHDTLITAIKLFKKGFQSNDGYNATIMYAKPVLVDLDTINLITLDSIIDCNQTMDIHWLSSLQFQKFQNSKPITYYTFYESEVWWVDFFIYDSKWTKETIMEQVNFDAFWKYYDIKDCSKSFNPELLKAIEIGEVIFFVRNGGCM